MDIQHPRGRILSDSVGTETANTLIHSLSSLSETIPDSRPKWAKSIPFSDRINGAKTIPFGASHLCMAYIMREYSPPPLPGSMRRKNNPIKKK